jgi:uncharacterized damage-inducible protein DinB
MEIEETDLTPAPFRRGATVFIRSQNKKEAEMKQAEMMTPEQALVLRDFLLPAIEGEYTATRRVLAAVPDDRDGYRPDPKSRTARELAWHIVWTEVKFFEDIARHSFGGPEPEPVDPTRGTAGLLAYYDEHFRRALELVKGMSAEELAAPIDFLGIANLPAVPYLLWLNNHSVHHRGQLSSYLRAAGSRVPAIYGPSADEPWSAAEASAGA